MGLLTKARLALARALLAPETKAGVLRVEPFMVGRPQYPDSDIRTIVKDGYESNSLVYAAVNFVGQGVSEAPLRMTADGAVLEDHPTSQLLARPNPWRSGYEFVEETVDWLLICGNAYWQKVRNENGAGQVRELWLLRPDRMRVVPGEDDLVQGWIYEIGGRRFPLLPEDVIHHRIPSLSHDILGKGPVQAAIQQIATDNEATDFVKALLENRAIPGSVVTVQEILNRARVKELRQQWLDRFGGSNRGAPAFLQEGMKVESLALNMQELDLGGIRGTTETRVCMAIGVPPIVLGAKVGLDRSTFANFEEAIDHVQHGVIAAMRRRIADRVNLDEELAPRGRGLVAFDLSQVAALEGERQAKWTRAQEAYAKRLITKNEAREMVGLPPATGGDEFDEPAGGLFDFGGDGEGGDQAPKFRLLVAGGRKTKALPIRFLRQKKMTKASEVALLAGPLGRVAFADTMLGRMKAAMRSLYREWGREAEVLVRSEWPKAVTPAERKADEDLAERMLKALEKLGEGWSKAANQKMPPLMTRLMGESGKMAAAEIGIAFDVDSEQVRKHVEEYSFRFAEKVSSTAVEDVRGVVRDAFDEGRSLEEVQGDLDAKFQDWSALRADTVARTETIRAANEGARLAYEDGGVLEMEWLASADSCEYCADLDGTRAKVADGFLAKGDTIEPEGAAAFEVTYEDVMAPPVHPFCGCTIIPVVAAAEE